MVPHAEDRVGVLVARVWLEASPSGIGLRGRVTVEMDLLAPGSRVETTAVAGIDEVCDVVRRWMTAFVEGSGAGRSP